MLQSLFQNKQVSDLVAEYGQVIVDRMFIIFQRLPSNKCYDRLKPVMFWDLRQHPYRRDGHQPIILMQCGPARYEIRQNELNSQAALHPF